MVKQKSELTFKQNLSEGRHGWLRLTPAYSVRLVRKLLNQHPELKCLLDPFSGTGTTGLVGAEYGLTCHLLDINPFLVWLGRVKSVNYCTDTVQAVCHEAQMIVANSCSLSPTVELWFPPISHIERWWGQENLLALARLFRVLNDRLPQSSPTKDLLLVAFCRLLIEKSNAAFNHQSISFRNGGHSGQMRLFSSPVTEELQQRFLQLVQEIVAAAKTPIPGEVNITQADARSIPQPQQLYDGVITSPPYPNRMSYVRELRPYMYWLGFLQDAPEAGELDWQAIGGTWGSATSRLQNWHPDDTQIGYAGFIPIVNEIRYHSPLLANYVHKYFVDIKKHLTTLWPTLARGAKLFYVVGNSKFYDTLVPVEKIYAGMFATLGYSDVQVETLRKRNSKKELFEFIVSARKPG
ncbi:MAG: hypothetical protein KJ063_15445 [Anaerolineae bacterium]|nr:hypothetical protein [Anaerolineae bacterium]